MISTSSESEKLTNDKPASVMTAGTNFVSSTAGMIPPGITWGSKRGLLMLNRAQQHPNITGSSSANPSVAAAVGGKKGPIHRTSSWPPSPSTFTAASPVTGGLNSFTVSRVTRSPIISNSEYNQNLNTHREASNISVPRIDALYSSVAGSSSSNIASHREIVSPFRANASSIVSNTTKEKDMPSILSAAEPSSVPNFCCYSCQQVSTQGKVTSLAQTDDGEYLFVAFCDGTVRVFHIATGNSDPEDRFGYEICSLGNSSSSQGSTTLAVHLEMGVGSHHLFVGTRPGTTQMIVLDVDSLINSQKSRGFITLSGGCVKTFAKSDTRLRGFESLISLSIENPQSSGGDSNESPFYVAKYRILCGRGFGSFALWNVVISYLPHTGYSDHWELIAANAVGAPSLSFGTFFRKSNDKYIQHQLLVLGSEKPALKSFSLPHDAENNKNDLVSNSESSNLVDDSTQNNEDEATLESRSLFVESCNTKSNIPTLGSGKTVKKEYSSRSSAPLSFTVKCASSNGKVLFGGINELSIFFVEQDEESEIPMIVSEHVYSLYEDDTVAGSRHLRQVETVCCTSDGSYALIMCSDLSVKLISPIDVFGNGRVPVRILGRDRDPSFIAHWFQAKETFNLYLGIYSLSNDRDPLSVRVGVCWTPSWRHTDKEKCGTIRYHPLLAIKHNSSALYEPAFSISREVMVETMSTSIIGEENCILCGDKRTHWVIQENLVFINSNSRKTVAKRSRNDYYESDDDATTDNDNGPVEPSKKTKVGRAKNTEHDVIEPIPLFASDSKSANLKSNNSKSVDNGKNVKTGRKSGDSLVIRRGNGGNAEEVGTKGVGDSLASEDLNKSTDGKKIYETLVTRLEAELQASRAETSAALRHMDMVVRKSDIRLVEEKRLRKEWNATKLNFETEKADLIAKIAMLEKSNEAMQQECFRALECLSYMSDCFKRTLRAAPAVTRPSTISDVAQSPTVKEASNNTDTNISSALPAYNMNWKTANDFISSSPSQLLKEPPSLFCVVCQSNTADVVFSACGHACLCFEHYKELCSSGSHLSENTFQNKFANKCPVCNKVSDGIVHIRGLS